MKNQNYNLELFYNLPVNQKATWREPVDEWLSVQGSALPNPVWAEAPSVSSGSASQLRLISK
jgi:hypothetical protein